MNRRLFVTFLIVFGTVSPLLSQESARKTNSLRSRPRPFSQKVSPQDGRPVRLERRTLTSETPLKYELPELKADDIPSAGQLGAILDRMRALQAAVEEAKKSEDGKKVPSDTIISRLQKRRQAEAGKSLGDDLGNLLITGLVELSSTAAFSTPMDGADPAAQPKPQTTTVWSYRRLGDHGNQRLGGKGGPTIEMTPNSVQLISLLNLLDKDELQSKTVPDFAIVDPVRSGPDASSSKNGPHGFDIVNLHTHGLNVSPNWPADNIFREIHPGQLKFFLYQIPADQTAGTYFYHPHNHGSVATQVAGGMAGPLIVRDPNAGLDQLGEKQGWGRATESILVFQQLTLYKTDENPMNRFTRPDFFAIKDVDPDLGQVVKERPEIQSIAKRLAGDPANNIAPITRLPNIETWISGEFQPQIYETPAAFDEIRRLRLVHAGVEDTVDFAIEPLTVGWPAATIQVIAWDGIPLKEPYQVTDMQRLTLSPGNRADVLVSIPSVPKMTYSGPLEYAILNRNDLVRQEKIFATLIIDPKKSAPKDSGFVTESQAKAIYDSCAPKPGVPEIPNHEAFILLFKDASIANDGTYTPGTFQIDGRSFPDDQKSFRLNHSMQLAFSIAGGDSTQPVQTPAHPLHIHVNPFLVPPDPNRGPLGLPVGEFWADTFLIQPQFPVFVTMPFHHWTGEFVSHCHILDHEDAGMMNLIRIRPDVFSWPEFPINEIMEAPYIPPHALKKLHSTWPVVGASIPGGVPDKVTVFVFMPANRSGKACPHCTTAVRAVADLRRRLKNQNSVRLVIVSATSAESMPDPNALGLLPAHDLICSDPNLFAFEALGLIDDVPVFENKELRFPKAFLPNTRTPIFESDVMHGLFLVDDSGMVVSSRRAFMAFDDTIQIMREIELAEKGRQKIRAAYEQAASDSNSTSTLKRLEKHRSRYESRLKEFEAK